MARLRRYFLPDQPLHVIQRGNNRDAIFFAAADYQRYHDWLVAAAAAFGCEGRACRALRRQILLAALWGS